MAPVSTVWMYPTTPQEYLIIGDQLLWFAKIMDCSLINPNHVRAFNIRVHNNPFDTTVFGAEADEAFNSFTSKGTVIIFELRVPAEW